MKKQQLPILILLTAVFVSFALGFFLGRNANHSPVQLAAPMAETEVTTLPTETTAVDTLTETTEIPASEQDTGIVSSAQSESSSAQSGLVNVNTATREELMTLPGIGEVIAQRIIDYREAAGPFKSTEDLIMVTGIGNKKLEAIIDLITVE